jgi:hypothetical protein
MLAHPIGRARELLATTRNSGPVSKFVIHNAGGLRVG